MPRQCPGHRRRGSSSWNPRFTGDPASPAQRTDGQAGAGASGGLFQSCRDLARGAALPRPAAPCPVRARRQVWRAGHPRRFGPRVQCGPSSRVSVPQALSPGVPASWKSDSAGTPLVTSEFPRAGVAPLLAVGSGPPGPEGVGGTEVTVPWAPGRAAQGVCAAGTSRSLLEDQGVPTQTGRPRRKQVVLS